MNDQDMTYFDPRIADWLEDDPNEAPDEALQVVLAAIPSIKQRHAMRLPWRFDSMSSSSKLALGAAAVIVVVLGGAFSFVGGAAPAPPPTSTPTPSVTLRPTPSPSPTVTPTNTADWTTYTSSQYGFPIGHPADWTVNPASRAWTWDDAKEFLNPAQENFHSADGRVRVSAWSVPFDPGTTIETWADVEAWAADYCQKADTGPCAGIHDRVVPLCLEIRDCHPALLVQFDNDVQAFFQDGFTNSDRMIVVAVWWGDSEPAVAPYGGSTQLLEAFLSTMGVVPANTTPYPPNGDAAATFLTTGR